MAAGVGYFGENIEINHFPGSYGYPLIGHTIDLYKDYYAFGLEMLERYGEIYRSNAAFVRYVAVASPDAVAFVLKDGDNRFSCKLGWEPFYGRVFPNSLPVMDESEHRHHRRILQSVFKKSNMLAYVDLVGEIASRDIADWQTDTPIEMFTNCKDLTLDVACKAFLGIGLNDSAQFVGETFLTLNKGIGALIPFPVPGFALWKSLRAQNVLLEHFRPMIKEKRISGGSDMFARLCNAKDEEDASLADNAILYHLLQFLAAAHDTSTTTLSVIFHFLLNHPEWQEQLHAEVSSMKNSHVGFDDLDAMVKTEWVIKESLRLFPPAPLMFRRAAQDCEYNGLKIPSGTQILIDIAAIQHSDRYWKNASKFEPERFSPERSEHKAHPYLWFPFGGGAHTCMGLHFTFMELKIILFHILRSYRVERASEQDDTFQILPITKPRRNLPLRLVRR